MKDEKLVDQQAVDFLAQCEEEGIQLLSCPPYIRAWITQEKIEFEWRLSAGTPAPRSASLASFAHTPEAPILLR